MFKRSALAVGAVSLLALVTAPSALATYGSYGKFQIEKLTLDTHGTVPGAFPEVSTTKPLKRNAYYLAIVDGTYSLWSSETWIRSRMIDRGCGAIEESPEYPSPGVTPSPVGLDAAVIFGAPRASVLCPVNGTSTVPQANSLFQIDQGSGPAVVPPIGGTRTKPSRSHTYGFLLRGQGSPASFRFLSADIVSPDNNGQLKIAVIGSCAKASECIGLN